MTRPQNHSQERVKKEGVRVQSRVHACICELEGERARERARESEREREGAREGVVRRGWVSKERARARRMGVVERGRGTAVMLHLRQAVELSVMIFSNP
jgi:hypothetical protein